MNTIKEFSTVWKMLRLLLDQKKVPSDVLLDHLSLDAVKLDECRLQLEKLGFPIVEMREGDDRYLCFMEGYNTHFNLKLNQAELISLWFCKNFLGLFKGTQVFEDFENIFEKIQKNLPSSYLKVLEEIFGQTKLGIYPMVDYSRFHENIEKIEKGISNGQKLQFKYDGKFERRSSSRTCEPYQVYFYDHSVYVIGYDSAVKKYRWFLIHRMTNVNLLEDTFEKRDDFDLEKVVQERKRTKDELPVTIHLRLDGWAMEKILDQPAHPSQKLVHNQDLTVDAFYKVPETSELISWILSMGSHCKVVSPSSVKMKVLDELHTILESAESGTYGKKVNNE